MLRKLAVTLIATTVSDPYLQVLWALLILVICPCKQETQITYQIHMEVYKDNGNLGYKRKIRSS